MKFNKYLLLLFFFCLSQINWVAKKIISPRSFGSEWGIGVYTDSFDIYRLLPVIAYMQVQVARDIARKVAMRPDVKEIFDSLHESVFKNEIRRQYFLIKGGLTLDDVQISFSVLELLNAGFFEEKIEEAKNSGKLDLSSSKIGNLEGLLDLLDKIPNVISKLDLSHNELMFVLTGDFENGFSRLKKLDLSFNKITFLEQRCFENLSELEILSLSYNKIRNLPAYVFSQQYKLLELDLSYNKIGVVKNYMFFGLKNLRKLNLADNPITEVVSKESLELPQLEELYLK